MGLVRDADHFDGLVKDWRITNKDWSGFFDFGRFWSSFSFLTSRLLSSDFGLLFIGGGGFFGGSFISSRSSRFLISLGFGSSKIFEIEGKLQCNKLFACRAFKLYHCVLLAAARLVTA